MTTVRIMSETLQTVNALCGYNFLLLIVRNLHMEHETETRAQREN